MEAKNVDDVLVKVINEQLTGTSEPPPVVETSQEPEQQQNIQEENVSQPEVNISEEKNVDNTQDQEQSSSSPIDEYGNPIEKQKTYTEEEVQNLIRDRLSRGRQRENQQNQQNDIRKEAENFKSDPNSEESWELQLENFIDRTISKRQQKYQEQAWQQQELSRQQEFESKFTSGMNKYKDFNQVVEGKPITDTMLLATRSLSDPAAFIYGASKLHPKELDKISKIVDPYTQAAEIGRLHERMVKERKVISKAGKPLETPRSDMAAKNIQGPSLEQRIQQHAKQKFAKR